MIALLALAIAAAPTTPIGVAADACDSSHAVLDGGHSVAIRPDEEQPTDGACIFDELGLPEWAVLLVRQAVVDDALDPPPVPVLLEFNLSDFTIVVLGDTVVIHDDEVA